MIKKSKVKSQKSKRRKFKKKKKFKSQRAEENLKEKVKNNEYDQSRLSVFDFSCFDKFLSTKT